MPCVVTVACHCTTALRAIVNPWHNVLYKAARGGKGWTAEHFAIVALLIANSPYHAVQKEDVLRVFEEALSPEDEERGMSPTSIFNAMIASELIVVRPYSDTAADIAAEALGAEQTSLVVTAFSATQLYCMLEDDFQAKLKVYRIIHYYYHSAKGLSSVAQ
jgi:hypothetical protein